MAQKVDIETVLPAILESANTYRSACDDFEVALDKAKERLNAAVTAVATAVAMAREAGLDIGDPFDFADPVGRALSQIRLARHPIRFTCEI